MSETTISNQFVTFRVSDEIYGINVSRVREILEISDITRVPGMPEAVKGVINNRGEIIPLLDLKRKFEDADTAFGEDTAIIVTEVDSGDNIRSLGLIVDKADEVVTVDESETDEAAGITGLAIEDFIMGIGRVNGGIIILLNIDSIISGDELAAVDDDYQ